MIRKAIDRIHHHVAYVRTVATKRVIQSFARKYGLVYFGNVSQHNDEHHLIRGITLSSQHRDRHYCVGSIQEYDVMLVQRTDEHHFPGKSAKHFTWLIMQIDLHTNASFPHIFVDGYHHNDTFYANVALKYNDLQRFDSSELAGHARNFINSYNVYGQRAKTSLIMSLLSPELTTTLHTQFKQFDFEIAEDKLYVYASNSTTTAASLNEMTRLGLWLARYLDSSTI